MWQALPAGQLPTQRSDLLKKELLIGVDLGGTNVRAGAFTPGGELITANETPIDAALGPAAGLKTIEKLINQVILASGQEAAAIGIGSTGPIDRVRGLINNPYTLPGWDHVDILSPLRARYGVQVAFENDADAAALGEVWMGAGRGVSRVFMLTIGTGVGAAYIVDGAIYRGLYGEHPEGGHIPVDPLGPACYCGGNGCLESLISGPAIAERAVRLASEHSRGYLGGKLNDPQGIDAATVFAGARQGDADCLSLVHEVAATLARGLASIFMLLLPDRVLLTGGVTRSFDLFEPTFRSSLAKYNVIIPASRVDVRLAGLGQRAGIYGAARAAQQLLE